MIGSQPKDYFNRKNFWFSENKYPVDYLVVDSTSDSDPGQPSDKWKDDNDREDINYNTDESAREFEEDLGIIIVGGR